MGGLGGGRADRPGGGRADSRGGGRADRRPIRVADGRRLVQTADTDGRRLLPRRLVQTADTDGRRLLQTTETRPAAGAVLPASRAGPRPHLGNTAKTPLGGGTLGTVSKETGLSLLQLSPTARLVQTGPRKKLRPRMPRLVQTGAPGAPPLTLN